MKILHINNFENGLISDIDGIDIPPNALSEISGLHIMPGLMKSYYPAKLIAQFTATDGKSFFEGVIAKNANDTEQFILLQDGSTLYKSIYSSGSYGTKATVGTFYSVKAKFIVVQKNVYIIPNGIDYTILTKKYQYINRKYFNDNVTYQDWYYVNAFLGVPDSSIYSLTGNGTGGTLSGKYFFRITYNYDDYQESSWQDISGTSATDTEKSIVISSYDTVDIDITLDPNAMDKRITGVNVYCAWNSDTTANIPSTPWYLIGNVYINDSNWTLSGTDYTIKITLNLKSGGASSDYPANHYTTGFDDALEDITDELYTKTNAIVGKAYWGIDGFGDAIFFNGRLFVIRPAIDYPLGLSYDLNQVLLFSQVDKPDEIQYLVDYIDLSTDEGDEAVAITSVNSIVLILKLHSAFMVNTFNTNKILNWQISDPIKGVGCISKHTVVKIKDGAIFAGLTDIFLTNGREFVRLTKNKIQEEYIGYINSATDYNKITASLDEMNNAYVINFPDSNVFLKYYLDEKRWEKNSHLDGFHDISYLSTGKDAIPCFINTDGDVLKLEDIDSTDYSVTNEFETGWMSLDGDPNSEKQIIWLKLIGDFESTVYIYLYKDFGSTATISKTVTGSSNKIIFEEISTIAKVIKIKVSSSSDNNPALFKLQDMEIKFSELGNR